MDQRPKPRLRVPPRRMTPRRLLARGTDVSFAASPDPTLLEAMDQAIERGVQLVQLESSEQLERDFYAGRI